MNWWQQKKMYNNKERANEDKLKDEDDKIDAHEVSKFKVERKANRILPRTERIIR